MTETNSALILLTLLGVKHFIVDFPLQNKFQWSNKGTYGHAGGILHAGLHGTGTYCSMLLLFGFSSVLLAFALGLIDMLIHYHVDWAKMNINKKYNWAPNTHEEFWWLLGFDQLLHFLTYVLIVAFVFN